MGRVYADGRARADSGHVASYRRYLRQLYRTLPAEEGQVYDAAGRLVFREGQRAGGHRVPATWLREVRRLGRAVLEPERDFHETVGLRYDDPRLGELMVLASSVGEDGREQLRGLRRVLGAGLLAAVVFAGVGGWVFAGQALRPLRRMVGEADGITASDLGQRLRHAAGPADELDRLAQRFNQLLDRLEATFAGQRAFARAASHELRTPLTALTGELEVALLQARPGPEYRRVLQRTLDAARQLTSLANGLLQIAQASGDPSQLPMPPVDLGELLLLAHEQVGRRYPTSRVDVDLGESAEAGAFVVLGNEPLLLAALLNVLDNACKFSAAGEPPVTATLARPAGRPTLLVTDEGPGLSAPDLEQVFVPFFRAAAARAVPGHGIGLPLTARIMALHGGAVRLASEPGRGTRVWLEWPQLS